MSPQITSTAQAFRLKVQMMPAAQASRLKVSPQITSAAQASRLKSQMTPAAQASRLGANGVNNPVTQPQEKNSWSRWVPSQTESETMGLQAHRLCAAVVSGGLPGVLAPPVCAAVPVQSSEDLQAPGINAAEVRSVSNHQQDGLWHESTKEILLDADDDLITEVEDEVHLAALDGRGSATENKKMSHVAFDLSASPSTASMTTLGGDPLYEWYASSDQDWEECRYVVPHELSSLQTCAAEAEDDPNTTYALESVSWEGAVDVLQQLDIGMNRHRVIAQVLEEDDGEASADGLGDISELQKKGVARLCKLEASNKQLQSVLEKTQRNHGTLQLDCKDRLRVLCHISSPEPAGVYGYLCHMQPLGLRAVGASLSVEDEFLQTKTIPNDAVRSDLERWKPAIRAEYNSLVHETRAVRPLSDVEFSELVSNPDVKCELIPGRAIFTIKAQTGRLKARIVACGCFQTGASRTKEDTFASGVSAESVRMLTPLAGLRDFKVGSLDIKTAFLSAPVITPNRETVIVRVPSILRTSQTCSEKYWVVDKSMYGLDVSPRSWVIHRNGVLAGIESLVTGRKVRCLPMEEDANIWVIVDGATDRIVTYLALYVDDVLVVGSPGIAEEVASTLESKWTTTPVSWATDTEAVVFDGFEITCHEGVYHVGQKSYTREMLSQHEDIPGLSQTPCSKEIQVPEFPGTRQDHIRCAQALTGQLLWLSGRTRPDLSFSVSQVGQLIVQDPTKAIARAHQIIRYVRHAPDIELKYGKAPDRYGSWDQLQWKQNSGAIDLFSDASFMSDQESRSVGACQMFWGGELIMWHCGRQPLISASTAEAELIAMAEAFSMGRSLKPLIDAFCSHFAISSHAALYTDNRAALQLCTLDSGSWRTRHLRLRGHMIREAVERGHWTAAHLEGVYMPADIGTKPLGVARFEDLLRVIGLHNPRLPSPSQPPNPKVAAVKTSIAKVLIALILRLVARFWSILWMAVGKMCPSTS